MKKEKSTHVAISLLTVLLGIPISADADTTYKCLQKDGKAIYQNWPCGSQPVIEKPASKGVDYPEIVKCSMAETTANLIKRGVGQQTSPGSCASGNPKR